jgi:hypothetical protein
MQGNEFARNEGHGLHVCRDAAGSFASNQVPLALLSYAFALLGGVSIVCTLRERVGFACSEAVTMHARTYTSRRCIVIGKTASQCGVAQGRKL